MASKTIKGAKQDYRTTKKIIKSSLNQAKTNRSKTIQGAKDDYKTVKNRIRSEFNKAKAKVTQAEKKAESYLKHNPKKAAAIAAGVGAAIGAAITAYMMREKKVKK